MWVTPSLDVVDQDLPQRGSGGQVEVVVDRDARRAVGRSAASVGRARPSWARSAATAVGGALSRIWLHELAEQPAPVGDQLGGRDEGEQVALPAEVVELVEQPAELDGGVDDVGRELEVEVDGGVAAPRMAA